MNIYYWLTRRYEYLSCFQLVNRVEGSQRGSVSFRFYEDKGVKMRNTKITGMLQVLYKNCPNSTSQSRNINNVHSRQRGKSDQVNAWKKDFTLWVPHKIFKTLPESEQKVRF